MRVRMFLVDCLLFSDRLLYCIVNLIGIVPYCIAIHSTPSSSFPHGKKVPAILSIVLTLIGFGISFGLGNDMGISIGVIVALLMFFTTCMKVPSTALVLAAVAALAVAGSHVTQLSTMIKARTSYSGVMCSELKTFFGGDDDRAAMMTAGYRDTYNTYCSPSIIAWQVAAILIWVATGVVIFLVPRKGENSEPLIQDLNKDSAPLASTTEYQKQEDTKKEEKPGELA